MARRPNTLKAVGHEIQWIQRAIARVGYTRDQNSQALVDASWLVIEAELFSNGTRKYALDLVDFEAKKGYKKLYYVREGNYIKYQRKIHEIRLCNDQQITSVDVEDLIQNKVIQASGISYNTWRKFIQEKPEPINKKAFKAYCEILELTYEEFTEVRAVYSAYPNREMLLQRNLITFNYTQQIQEIDRIAKQPKRVQAYLIQGVCYYSRIWLLRRIEAEICSLRAEFQYIELPALDSSTLSLSLRKLDRTIGSVLGKIDIQEALRHKSIILLIEGVDTLNTEGLRQLLYEFWQSLTEEVSSSKNFLLFFLIDKGQQNDWREQLNEFKEILIPLQSKGFYKDDLKQFIPQIANEIAKHLQQSSNNQEIADFTTKLCKKAQFEDSDLCNPQIILEYLYKFFRCQINLADSYWSNYP